VKHFAQWLSTTLPSVYIQEHNAWVIPAIQSIHIVGIAMVMGSVLLIDLRILGWAGMDQTLRQTVRRFGPWLSSSLWLLLATGILMVVGEPVRELITFSFWAKMALIAVGTIAALIFQSALRRHDEQGENALANAPSIKTLAILTFLIWLCVIVLGRLIAYDHVWGAWSPSERR